MSGRYVRPVLCRLCGFPAPDGGVPVSQLDREKLSEWCLRVMDTDLNEEELDKAVFCQFCVSDARFERRNSTHADTLDFELWDNIIGESKWDRYSTEDLIQPCAVKLDTLPPKQMANPISNSSSIRTQRQHSKNKHQCPYCSASFSANLILATHVVKIHRDISTFGCKFCKSYFKGEVQRQKHTELKHKHFTCCIYCNKSINTRSEYDQHMQVNHKDEAIKCPFYNCALYFLCEADLEKHVEKKHMKAKVECIYCKKSYAAISQHMYVHHRKEAIRCNYQNVVLFHTEEDKMKHLLEKHKTDQCVYCLKMISDLPQHVRKSHNSEETFKCDFSRDCHTYFLSEEERQKHVKEVHKDLKKLECIYCKRMYKGAINLRAHVYIYHSDVKIKCSGCARYFLSEENRKEHIRLEHGKEETTFHCEKCIIKSRSMKDIHFQDLMKHKCLQLKCPECPTILRSHLLLKWHLKVHKQIKE